METTKKKIVIVGGGFAGVYAYLELFKNCKKMSCFDVTLINKADYFDFVVLSHEIATGGLMPSDVTQSLHRLPKGENTRFIQGTVTSLNTKEKRVFFARDGFCKDDKIGGGMVSLPYDYVLLALGSETDTFGVPGVGKHTLSLKNLEDAKKLKNRILESFEVARGCDNEDHIREMLTFVVIGGGPTGVELSAEIADFVFDEVSSIYPELSKKTEVVLLHSGDRLISVMDKWFHKKSMKILKKLGVQVLLNKKVTEVTERNVFMGEEKIATRNVFWSAGVKSRYLDIESKNPFSKEERTGRIKVNDYLQVIEDSSIYVAGDMSWIVNRETNQPYPMRAQFAVKEGITVAQNIISDINRKKKTEFSWRDQGFIVSLGRGGALAEVFGMRFSGPVAWWLYRTAYLSKLVGIRAKLRTGLEWAINLAFSRDISKL